ncbi:menaquinone-dependent succinate dehydrogenase/fumarate reductase, flavoprotein subunit [Mycobacteroides abscessus subsp. massiliense]|nr:menaquinone-dependent succinate dehydrogenase/fumarate reductase, flavoprotein subunit [Mycobacteroides abscessus subsp. massiliense]
MQGLADGYFVLPTTIADYLARGPVTPVSETAVTQAENRVHAQTDTLLAIKGDRTVDSFHRQLGHIMWEYVGMVATRGPRRSGQVRRLQHRNLAGCLIFGNVGCPQ